MFSSILTAGGLTLMTALLCTLVSLVLGLFVAFLYLFRNRCSKGFAVTLVLLPILVQAVIMMVNGNLGTGVAVLGAFSLIRFRSVPGSSKEICCIFFAMAIGLATGMGYLAFAALIAAVVGAALLILTLTPFGEKKAEEKTLRIVIPENLDYTALFDDLFAQYASTAVLEKAKTVNMGSLFELSYRVVLKDSAQEKAFLDECRCRNGNLTVSIGRIVDNREEL